jgi:hypothetical protein
MASVHKSLKEKRLKKGQVFGEHNMDITLFAWFFSGF